MQGRRRRDVEVGRGERVRAGKPEHQKAHEEARKDSMEGTMVDCLGCDSCSPMWGRQTILFP